MPNNKGPAAGCFFSRYALAPTDPKEELLCLCPADPSIGIGLHSSLFPNQTSITQCRLKLERGFVGLACSHPRSKKRQDKAKVADGSAPHWFAGSSRFRAPNCSEAIQELSGTEAGKAS